MRRVTSLHTLRVRCIQTDRFEYRKRLGQMLRHSLLAISFALVLLPAMGSADGALSQGLTTTEPNLTTGGLLSLKSGSKSVVESTTLSSQSDLLGVVGNRPLIAIDSGGQRVQVVVTGLAPVLVSDINGDVKTGDYITASPIKGVGMKATGAGLVVGTAQGNLRQASTTPHSVKDKTGKAQTVKIGLIQAQINVRYFAARQDKLKPLLPSFLLTLGSTIAGKDVSGLRVIVGLLVLLLGFLTVAVMMQAAIRSGIIAIGRNPMAHTDLRRSLIDVAVTALSILVLSILLIYIILTS